MEDYQIVKNKGYEFSTFTRLNNAVDGIKDLYINGGGLTLKNDRKVTWSHIEADILIKGISDIANDNGSPQQ